MKMQRGGLLIEIMLVVALIIGLSMWALPELSRTMTQNKMEAASHTIRQTAQRARLMARNKNTWVELKLQQGQLVLSADNDPQQSETIGLPRDIVIVNGINLRFTPNGVLQNDGQNMLATRQIQIHANNGMSEDISLTIDPMGWVSL